MSVEAELSLAREVFEKLLPDSSVEMIDQAGGRFLKVKSGERTATLQMRTDQTAEIHAMASELLALTRLDAASKRIAELEAENDRLEKELASKRITVAEQNELIEQLTKAMNVTEPA